MKVRSVKRIFDIVEALSMSRSGMTLAELSAALELHRSTVHRFLADLAERGYVDKDRDSSHYRLGLRFIELTGVYLDNVELKTEARPHLVSLSNRSGHTAFIAFLDGSEVVYIDKAEQQQSLRRYSIVGTRAPLYCTALGKALLMSMSDAEFERAVHAAKLARLTRNTITSVDELIAEISRSRERGWAMDNCERYDDIRCVAAPILDYRRQPIAAVSVSDYARNLPLEEMPVLGNMARETAGVISRLMGYTDRTGRNALLGGQDQDTPIL